MKNYRLLDACENCKHTFTKSDPSSDDEIYCTLGADERPLCGDMDERWAGMTTSNASREERQEAYRKGSRKWDTWAEGREVKPHGKCDNWEGE